MDPINVKLRKIRGCGHYCEAWIRRIIIENGRASMEDAAAKNDCFTSWKLVFQQGNRVIRIREASYEKMYRVINENGPQINI